MVKTTNLFFQCSTWSCGLLDKNPTQLYNTRQGTSHSTFSTWCKRHGLLLPSPLPTVDVRMILSAPKMVWRRLKSAVPVSRCMLSEAILSFSSTVYFLRYRHVLKAIGAVERKGSGLREQMALKTWPLQIWWLRSCHIPVHMRQIITSRWLAYKCLRALLFDKIAIHVCIYNDEFKKAMLQHLHSSQY